MNDAIARRLLKKRDITTGGDSLISLNSLPQNPFTDSRRNAEQSKKLNNRTGQVRASQNKGGEARTDEEEEEDGDKEKRGRA